jgi:PAS domain S-box-containing protein
MPVQSRYQSIFETTLDGIIVISNRGIIEDINSAGLKLFEYEKKEVVGHNIKMLMPEPDNSQHDAYLHNYRATRKPKIIGVGRDVEGLKKGGVVFPFRLAVSEFETDGEQHFTGIIHDLTQRKIQERIISGYAEELEDRVEQRTKDLKKEMELRETAQKALVDSQRLYEIISRNYPNGTISVIDNEYVTVFVEGSELRRLGFDPEKLLGQDYRINIPEKWKSTLEEKLRQVFKGEEVDFEYGDDDRVYRVRCVPLITTAGEVEQVLIVENNITQEKRAEREIYATLNKEKQLNELKTNFVSMASHEFRTPLSSILSSAALVGKYTESEQQENRIKHLNKIRKNVQNLTMILNDFLSLERIEGGYVKYNPEPLDICEFLEGLAEEAEALVKPNQKIEVINKLECAVWNIDSFLLRNILTNLISNAIKYSDESFTLVAEGTDKLEISVIDKGIGISEEDQTNLFNRFYRASNAGQVQGTGLGLNIVKRYVNLMDGEITFESTLGEGSIFILLLNGRNK